MLRVPRLKLAQQTPELVQLPVQVHGWATTILDGGQANSVRSAVLLKAIGSLGSSLSKRSGTIFARPRKAVPSITSHLAFMMICVIRTNVIILGRRNPGIASIVELASEKLSGIRTLVITPVMTKRASPNANTLVHRLEFLRIVPSTTHMKRPFA